MKVEVFGIKPENDVSTNWPTVGVQGGGPKGIVGSIQIKTFQFFRSTIEVDSLSLIHVIKHGQVWDNADNGRRRRRSRAGRHCSQLRFQTLAEESP